MTGRRASSRQRINQEPETPEKIRDYDDEVEEGDEDALPEKRLRTSTRSNQFDYSGTTIVRARRKKKAVVRDATTGKFISEKPLGSEGGTFPLNQSLISDYDETVENDDSSTVKIEKDSDNEEGKESSQEKDAEAAGSGSDDESEAIAKALGLRKIMPRNDPPSSPSSSPKQFQPTSNLTEREAVIYVPTPVTKETEITLSATASKIEPKSPAKGSSKRKRKKVSEKEHTCPEGYVTCKLCYDFFPSEKDLNEHERSKHPDVSSYQCTICNYCSLEKSLMTRHMKTHSGQRPFNCSVCGYAFTTKANCERHIKKRHELTDKLEIEKHVQYDFSVQKANDCEQSWKLTQKTVCMHCDARFDDFWSLRDHMKIHDKRSFYCSTCQAAFSCRSNCIAHIMQKHNVIDREVAAEMVDFDEDLTKVPKGGRVSFRGKTGLKRKTTKRQEKGESEEEQDAEEEQPEKPTFKFPYKCDICKCGFHDFKLAHDHIKYRHWKDFKGFLRQNILFSEHVTNEEFTKIYDRVKNQNSLDKHIVGPSPVWCRAEVKSYIRKKRPKGNHVHILKDSSLHSIMRNIQNHKNRTMSKLPYPTPKTTFDLAQLQSKNLANVEFVELHDKPGEPPKQLAVVKNIVQPNLITTQSQGSTPTVIYQSDDVSTLPSTSQAGVKSIVKQVNRKNLSMGNGPIPTINGIDYYQDPPELPKVPQIRQGKLVYNLAIKPAPSPTKPIDFKKANTLFKTQAIVREARANQTSESSTKTPPKVQFTVKSGNQSFKLTQKQKEKRDKPGVFVPLDTTSIPIASTTKVDSASVYVPTNVVNYEEVYTDESPQKQKVVTTPAILKTLPVIKSKNDKPSEQPVEVLPSNVLSSDYVEEIGMTYDEPAEPKTKNIKLKNLRANGKVDERPCPKCGKTFPWASSLRRHLLTHTGMKPYMCSLCRSRFTTKSNLERHVLRRHGIFDRESQAACVIKLSKEEMQAMAAEEEQNEEADEKEESMEGTEAENTVELMEHDGMIGDGLGQTVLVPVTEEEIAGGTFLVQHVPDQPVEN